MQDRRGRGGVKRALFRAPVGREDVSACSFPALGWLVPSAGACCESEASVVAGRLCRALSLRLGPRSCRAAAAAGAGAVFLAGLAAFSLSARGVPVPPAFACCGGTASVAAFWLCPPLFLWCDHGLSGAAGAGAVCVAGLAACSTCPRILDMICPSCGSRL